MTTTTISSVGHFIQGTHKRGQSARTSPFYEPATGALLGEVELADAELVSETIHLAGAAQPAWAALNPQRRARVLMRFLQIADERRDQLAHVLSTEHGKTLPDARGEIQRGLEAIEFACGIPHLLKGEFSESVGTGIDTHSLHQPLGVVAGITPFNFPAMIPMWMFGIALGTGNSFILKPSEKNPSVPLLLAEWLSEAGLPDGVFNVINGDKEAVDILIDHPRIEAISFVGSSKIAESLYCRGASKRKRVQAMGGAKNHMIILPDADLENAADALIGAAFGSAGERCMAISVAVPVGQETADRLRELLIQRINSIRVGPSLDATSDYGPLITQAHFDTVRMHIEAGVQSGAELVLDGRNLEVSGHADGFYLGPCLFDQVQTDMPLYQEEIFGPVLSITRANTFDEAIQLPSKHQYGNGVALYTRSGAAAREFASKVNVGMVGINIPLPVPISYYTFGGWKRSAYGGFNQHGMDGVRFYTKTKTVVSRWPNDTIEQAFAMPTF